jgi:hypothetical protein
MRTKSSQFSRVAIALVSSFLIACWLMGASSFGTRVRAQAQTCAPGQTTLTVMSGNGVVGGLDSQVQSSTNGGATFQSATIVSPFILGAYSWANPIAGSQWVSVDSNRGNSFPNTDLFFRATFTLPASFASPSLAIQVHSDNVATIYLNGTQFGMQPDVVPNGDVANFQDPPEVFTTTASFQPGTNVLSIKVHNYADQTGLDFRADICYSPAQGGCVDRTPPSVSCSVHETQLWPPNHDLENVGLRAEITDDCDCFKDDEPEGDDDDDDDHGSSSGSSAASNGGGSGSKVVTGGSDHHSGGDDDDDDDGGHCAHPPGGSHSVQVIVYSDEPDLDIPGSGNFSPDAKNIALGTLRLRSERSGNGDGRVYLIVVKATDASGKVGYCAKTVTVPHDQSNASKNSVAAQANAARTYFLANHVPPPSYVQVGTGPITGPKQ